MEPILDMIITHGTSIDESINKEYLFKFTSRIEFQDISKERWREVQHLYVIGTEDYVNERGLSAPAVYTPGCYIDETENWVLLVSLSKEQVIYVLANCGAALRRLVIQYTTLEVLKLSHLIGLIHLELIENKNLWKVYGLKKFENLELLSLWKTSIGPVLNLNTYKKLREIQLVFSEISEISVDHELPELEDMYLSLLEIHNLDFIKYFPNLKDLFMLKIPIDHLPGCLRNLKSLQRLRLVLMKLEDLPDWLPELNLPISRDWQTEGISFDNVIIDTVEDMSIFDQSQEFIRRWFQSRREGVPLNEVKVVFLGDGEAGKSHTIARLLNDGGDPVGFDGNSTPGVVIRDKDYLLDGRTVKVHFWDFGGQEILHSMHRMFLTSRTLYVVLINARDDTQDDRARYWLHNIKSFAKNCPVLLVLNKVDQNPNASVNFPELKRIYPQITQVVHLSALKDCQEAFNQKFTQAMLHNIAGMDILDEKMFESWQKVKNSLQGMTQNYIFGSDYAKLCADSGIVSEGDLQKDLLGLFHDLGVTVCYRKNLELRDYVVLRPNWIINAVYAAIFNKHPEDNNGLMSHEVFFDIIQGDYQCTNPDEQYHGHELKYILGVFRQFGLSFQVKEDQEFIPMLCQRESLPVALEYADDEFTLEFHMEFEYLPSNVLHRLMVEMRRDLDLTQVWRTGALFTQQSIGLSAVVRSEGNVLKLYVKSEDPHHHANTYLCEIKAVIDGIVEDMGLAKPTSWIIYKENGRRDAFEYDLIVQAKRSGMDTWYSKVFRKISIDAILDQSSYMMEKEWALARNVLNACLMLQRNHLYWKGSHPIGKFEDDRNTFIRDALQSMNMVAADQSLSGISATGKKQGELDIDLRLEPSVPFSIYEALNIAGATKQDLDNWETHLCKLIDNYNPNGLPCLFLVSYVDCTRIRFTEQNGVSDQMVSHARSYAPEGYQLEYAEELSLEWYQLKGQFLRMVRSTYGYGENTFRVYHIFVQLGNEKQQGAAFEE